MKILRKNISELHGKKAGSDKKISQLKLNLRETFGMSGNFVENTVKWLRKKVRNKVKVKIRLKKKYSFLLEEKKKLDELWRKKKEQVNKDNQTGKRLHSRCDKKVVYNNSSRVLTEKEIELLSLGLNFGMTPKKFPLVEYITATEVLCKSLEATGEHLM